MFSGLIVGVGGFIGDGLRLVRLGEVGSKLGLVVTGLFTRL